MASFPYSFGRSRTGRVLAVSVDIEVCVLHILADIAESDGIFHSDMPGTFESDMDGTFNVLQAQNHYIRGI